MALAIWLVTFCSFLLDVKHLSTPSISRPPPDAPEVAVIVPARNEAHQLQACLRSLLAQDWPRLRVVCVDDRSEDGTYEVAAAIGDPRLTVVRGTELPPGWLGKNHANVQGVLHAGDATWLLFTDADTEHAPAALATAYAGAQQRGADLYTLLADVRCESFWELVIMPHVLAAIVMVFPVRLVNDPRSAMAIANGQFLFVRRAAYEAAGGHAAIRARVADDLELARLMKSRGFRLWVDAGRELVSVRMYTSFRDIWWGFVKNAAAGSGGTLLAFLGAGVVALMLLPFFALPFVHGAQLAMAGAAVALALGQRAWMFALLFPVNPLWVLSLPVSGVIFIGIVLHSAVRQLTGRGPIWKGREYPHGH